MTIHIPKDHLVEMPDGNTYYAISIIALKHHCRMETLGFRSPGRRTACQMCREMLGLPSNKRKAEVADMMEEVVRQIQEARNES